MQLKFEFITIRIASQQRATRVVSWGLTLLSGSIDNVKTMMISNSISVELNKAKFLVFQSFVLMFYVENSTNLKFITLSNNKVTITNNEKK